MGSRDGRGLRRLAEEIEGGERRECADACCEGAEELDGKEAVGVQGVVNIAGEVGADGFGADGDAGSPVGDDLVDVGEAGIAAGVEVGDELRSGEAGGSEGLGADGPDGGDPGKAGELAPEVG